jgi:CRISPR-associated protein Csc1
MTNNRVATAREDLPLQRQGTKPSSFRASNFPQTGRLRMIERGNKFQTLVFGNQQLPDYIRVGKFASKVKVNVLKEFPITLLPEGEYKSQFYLNVADLPTQIEVFAFDLLSIPPAPILKNLHFRGAAWQIGEMIVPAGLHYCGRENGNE